MNNEWELSEENALEMPGRFHRINSIGLNGSFIELFKIWIILDAQELNEAPENRENAQEQHEGIENIAVSFEGLRLEGLYLNFDIFLTNYWQFWKLSVQHTVICLFVCLAFLRSSESIVVYSAQPAMSFHIY